MTGSASTDRRAALQSFLQMRRGNSVSIETLRRIATGNSRSNWFVRMADGDRYVVRVEQGGVFGTSSAEEFAFMGAARRLGCAVAPPRWFEPTGEVLGEPFFVMDFVDGVAEDRNDRSMSPELTDDFVGRLAELHATDWTGALDDLGDAAAVTPADATHVQIDRWYDLYRTESPTTIPLLEEGAAWLHHHAPPMERVSIVHGDPGPGNFVHDGHAVVAFTDWEFTHLGDAAEDWVYLVTMRGSRTMAPDEWAAVFDRVAGVRLGDEQLRFWSAFNYFKGACANLTCRRVFATTNPAPNMGLIGTALHQTFVRGLAGAIA